MSGPGILFCCYCVVAVVPSLLDLNTLDVEDQGGVLGDAGERLRAVGVVGRDGDTSLTTNLHAGNTDVPALDDLTGTELEAEGLALLVGVEDLAVLELADVAHTDAVTLLCGGAGAGLLVVDGDAVDGLDGGGSLGLLSTLCDSGGARAGGTQLEVLRELYLFV
jgi:hypothetical protein